MNNSKIADTISNFLIKKATYVAMLILWIILSLPLILFGYYIIFIGIFTHNNEMGEGAFFWLIFAIFFVIFSFYFFLRIYKCMNDVYNDTITPKRAKWLVYDIIANIAWLYLFIGVFKVSITGMFKI